MQGELCEADPPLPSALYGKADRQGARGKGLQCSGTMRKASMIS